VQIRFTQGARKHRIGKTSARYVMATVTPVETVTKQGAVGWLYVGRDERDRELEVIAVEIQDSKSGDPCLLVIHVMPTSLRRGNHHA
jgi:hypothetical protein